MIRLVLIAILAVVTGPPASGDAVTVRISCRDANDAPIGGLCVGVRSQSQLAAGRSDGRGELAVRIEVGAGDTELGVHTQQAVILSLPIEAQTEALIERQKSLRNSFSFGTPLGVPIRPGISSYELKIRGVPAITVTGRIVDPEGAPQRAALTLRGGDGVTVAREDGRFELHGVPAGRASEVFFSFGHRVTAVLLPAFTADADIGDLRAWPADGDSPLFIEPVGVPKVDDVVEGLGRGVTLISADGQTVYSYFMLSGQTYIAVNTVPERLPRVRPGTYYVIPGTFRATPSQLRLLDAVKSGVDLRQHQLPQVTAITGQTASLRLDMTDALAKVKSLPQPSSDSPPGR